MRRIANKHTGSTAYSKINNVLRHYDWYSGYLEGKTDSRNYLRTLLQHKTELILAGLNEDQINLSSRFLLNNEQAVDHILDDLLERKIIKSVEYPKERFDLLFQKVADEFMHATYTTYIFPEEARLLYALTWIVKPKKMLFMGSYYGYWAIWSASILKETGGVAYLIDIDRNVLALAEKNMAQFNCDSVVRLVNEDAIQFMMREKISHDFLVVDPEGPKQGADPDLLDKAIYYPMVKAAHPCLATNGIVLCHNILLNNLQVENKYFEKKIKYNFGQFSKFLPFMKENYESGVWYDTTEGVGIFAHKKQP